MRQLMDQLRYLLNRREQIQALVLLVAMAGGALLEMAGIAAVAVFVALLSDPEGVRERAVVARLSEWLGLQSLGEVMLAAALCLLVLFLLKNAYLAALVWVKARYVFNRQVAIAQRLFAAYLQSPYTFHLQRNTADLVRNTNQDAMQAIGSGLVPLLTLIMETMTVGTILLLLVVVEPLISLLAFVVLGGTSYLFLRFLRTRTLYYGKEMQHHRGRMIQAVNEGLGGVKVTKVLGREEQFLSTFARHSDSFAAAGRFQFAIAEIPRLFLESAAILGILCVAGVLVLQGRSSAAMLPVLALLATATLRMIPSFNRITIALGSLRYGRYPIQSVYEDLQEIETNAPARNARPSGRPSFERSIQLEGVTYRYPNAGDVSLQDITLEIARGSAVGIVGATGAGKTTLVDIILGLLEPGDGRVLIDGCDLSKDPTAWQRQLGYVPQDIYLSDDTIRHNVAFGLSDEQVDEESVQRAIEAAQLESLVGTLPEGLETMVGERGIRLSGGQRQRIGIARALYHRPNVLIMDEATAALDNVTEQYVMKAIEPLRGELTVIMIAHRLSTVKDCDRLFYLSDGRLQAAGTYEELLASDLTFRSMATV